MQTLVLATHNAGKVEEMAGLLGKLGVTVKTAADYNCPEPEETGTTFLENALLKARFVAQFTGSVVLADDSGLCVDGLGGEPGVYSADWAQAKPDGPRDFNVAMRRVIDELIARQVPKPWTASFHAVLILCSPNGDFEVFQGKCPGTIIEQPRGSLGHGYDPIFVPAGSDKTFAEMSVEEKSKISHRGNALADLVAAWPLLDLAA